MIAKLIIMDGQSNNGGVSFISNLPGYLDFVNTDVKIWMDSAFSSLSPGVNNWGEFLDSTSTRPTNRWGGEMELAYQIRQNAQKAFIVKVGHGARGLYLDGAVDDFNINSVGEYHDNMISQVNIVINNAVGNQKGR